MTEPKSGDILLRMDLRGHSPEEHALDLIVAMPVAVERLRSEGPDSPLAAQIIDSLCEHLRASDDPAKFRFVAGAAADVVYKHASELTVMGPVTHAYCSTVCDLVKYLQAAILEFPGRHAGHSGQYSHRRIAM